MRRRRLLEIHVTDHKSPNLGIPRIPDLRGVRYWQNLLRKLLFIVQLDSVQISYNQYRHFRGLGNDYTVSIYEY